MAYSGRTARLFGRINPALLGTLLTRLGIAILALTLPVVASSLGGLVAAAGSPATGAALALGAMDGPLLGGTGLTWLFHASTLGALCGCWVLGAGLLLSGLYD